MVTTYTGRARPDPRLLLTPPTASGPRTRFRPDIEGLRAVAVLLVVLNHAGVPYLNGGYVGVDVFFVISGFLITTLLIDELARRGAISVAGFYARRATRLLPAATLAIVATGAAAWYWLPPARVHSVLTDALASAVYGINYRLAIEGTDYLAASESPSPFKHFWSLAVEEQFYLVWPMLLLVASLSWLGRRSARTAPMAVVILLVVAASFAASIWETQRSAPWAYFGAHTRAWELGLGALVALLAGALARIPRPLAAALTWIGLAGVVAAALLFSDETAFPGYAATLPVSGAALIIAGGCATPRGGSGLLLHCPPFQLVGRLSYGWYLWHWPVLLIAPTALGQEPTLALNLGLAGYALGLAAVSFAVVENPLRTNRWWRIKSRRGISLGASLSASAVTLALVGATVPPPAPVTGGPAPDTRTALAGAADPAQELTDLITASRAGLRTMPSNLVPALAEVSEDIPAVYDDGCHLSFEALAANGACVYGDVGGSTTVVLFGDSHAAHWQPALDEVAKSRGWRLISLTKSACPAPAVATINPVLRRPYDECVTWRAETLDKIRDMRPALVIMSSNGGDSGGLAQETDDPDQAWVDGWLESVRLVSSSDTQVFVIADTPWPEGNVPDCVAAHQRDVSQCAHPVDDAVLASHRRQMMIEAMESEDVTVIDPTQWFCADELCPPMVGNVLVYSDDSHMSATYSRLLAPLLAAELP